MSPFSRCGCKPHKHDSAPDTSMPELFVFLHGMPFTFTHLHSKWLVSQFSHCGRKPHKHDIQLLMPPCRNFLYFSMARESVLPLWSQTTQARRSASDASTPELFVFLHWMLFTFTHSKQLMSPFSHCGCKPHEHDVPLLMPQRQSFSYSSMGCCSHSPIHIRNGS